PLALGAPAQTAGSRAWPVGDEAQAPRGVAAAGLCERGALLPRTAGSGALITGRKAGSCGQALSLAKARGRGGQGHYRRQCCLVVDARGDRKNGGGLGRTGAPTNAEASTGRGGVRRACALQGARP